ncbi:MAG: DUF302 domain-containing protein [Nitrospirae bacterium]|nr:DUF302 domain-containing protein [Nitrospirota bacterium]
MQVNRKVGVSIVIVGFIFALAGLTDVVMPAYAGDMERSVERISNVDFKTTVSRLDQAIRANHLMVVGQFNHQNMLTMMNMKIKGSQTFEVFHPQYGKMLFEADPAAGIVIPPRLYVFEREDGKTIVVYYRPSAAFAPFKNRRLDDLGRTLDNLLESIVVKATK